VDPNLKVQPWLTGAKVPSGFAFIDDVGSGLMLEKNTGKVLVYENRAFVKTALDLSVSNDSEQGLLGIALSPDFATDRFVYLYYTASAADGGTPISNSVKRFRYDPAKKTLSFVKKVIDLPASPGPNHNGGKIAFGPDGKLYIAAGELNRNEMTSNDRKSDVVNPIGAVLRLNSSGSTISTNPFYNAKKPKRPANYVYAYGIRNSFGMAWDPVSGTMWMSENGPSTYDEINRVTPGFNSGWEQTLGPSSRNTDFDPATLVSLGDRMHYDDPEFSWKYTVAPTATFFQPNTRLGSQYKNDLFVGSVRGGKLYHFDLTASRKDLSLEGVLADKVADNLTTSRFKEQDAVLWGKDFGTITEILSGPGGMYVLSYTDGTLYRITNKPGVTVSSLGTAVPEPGAASLLTLACLALARRRNKR
jgi:glucose/arabinose dehydrogenase